MLLSQKKWNAFLLIMLFFSLAWAQQPKWNQSLEFTDLSGNPVTFDDFKSQITVVNFWATWCAACLKEMPNLQKLHQTFSKDQVNVVGVVVMSDTGKINQMLKITGADYPIFIGTRQDLKTISQSLVIPQTIVLDDQGNILTKFEGAQNYQTFASFIKNYLDQVNLSTHSQKGADLSKD